MYENRGLKIYSDDDKFASGIVVVTMVPMTISRFLLGYTEELLFASLIAAVVFIAIVWADGPVLRTLYSSGGQAKSVVLCIIFTAFFNIGIAFLMEIQKWVFFPALAWSLLVIFQARRVFREHYHPK